jgi:NDP-sugar pyrophosphorylase family protein
MPKAMILAAGTGTRLMPMTTARPKAMVPLAGKPLIEHVLDRFREYNITDVLVNLHHHADQLQAFLSQEKFRNFNISVSDEREKLLDTGGGIRKAAWFFNDGRPFLVHNSDVISAIPLDQMLMLHLSGNAIATLAVSKRKTSRPLAFDKNGKLIDRWDEKKYPDGRALAFSGIYILDPAIFSFMPDDDVFSIVDVMIRAAKDAPVLAFEHSPEIWVDAGTIKNFKKAEDLIKNAHL